MSGASSVTRSQPVEATPAAEAMTFKIGDLTQRDFLNLPSPAITGSICRVDVSRNTRGSLSGSVELSSCESKKTCAHQLAMNILDAGIEIFMILLLPNLIPIVAVEYQFDRKKLTFFFEAGG